MSVIIATEIYGQNVHTAELARRLSLRHGSVLVVDPYRGESTGLSEEEAAHARFQRECGPQRYAALLALKAEQMVSSQTAPHLAPAPLAPSLLAIGFSAGAVAVWSLACNPASGLSRAVCLYGSGIRHQSDSEPRCPVDVVLPAREPHFDVQALEQRLRDHAHVTCHRTPWLHGFMNPLSPNYSPQGAEMWLHWLETLRF